MSADQPHPAPSHSSPDHHRFAIISRMFDAPRELVFSLAGPTLITLRRWSRDQKGCTVGFCNMDLRPGGQLRYNLRLPDGQEMWGQILFTAKYLHSRPPRLRHFLLRPARYCDPRTLQSQVAA